MGKMYLTLSIFASIFAFGVALGGWQQNSRVPGHAVPPTPF